MCQAKKPRNYRLSRSQKKGFASKGDTDQLPLILITKKGLPLAILCRILLPSLFAPSPERMGVLRRDRASVVHFFAAIPDLPI
jgi:hypothetical protein